MTEEYIQNKKYEEVMQRLDNLNSIDIDERFRIIEHHMRHFISICTSINKAFQYGVEIKIDSKAADIILPIKEVMLLLKNDAYNLRAATKNLKNELENEPILGTLKFMAKQIQELTYAINEIKEKGLKKKIHLDFTMDGYEMIKKKVKYTDPLDDPGIEPEIAIENLLKTLSEREQKVLIYRYGLLGYKQLTLAAAGKILKLSAERIRALQSKALRKCRHHSRKKLVAIITHLELKHDILGE